MAEEEREGEREARFILMPKSNRLLHGIRDGITSYQRICTLRRCNPSSCCSTKLRHRGTMPGRRARTMHVGGNTRTTRTHSDILPPSFLPRVSWNASMDDGRWARIDRRFLPIFPKSCLTELHVWPRLALRRAGNAPVSRELTFSMAN